MSFPTKNTDLSSKNKANYYMHMPSSTTMITSITTTIQNVIENLDSVHDVNELKTVIINLNNKYNELKQIIAEERAHNQKIEFSHRESIDQVNKLEHHLHNIKEELSQEKLRNEIKKNNYDLHSENSNNEDNTEKIEALKDEIEELQAALAEERMLNMHLDLTHRQSQHRADKLQYELAEEKLKNIHLTQSQSLELNTTSKANHHVDTDKPSKNDTNGRENQKTEVNKLNENIKMLKEQLIQEQKEKDGIEIQRRNSITAVSQNMFKKLLDESYQHKKEKENLEKKIKDLNEEFQHHVHMKNISLQFANDSIQDLRNDLKKLSMRLLQCDHFYANSMK